MIMIELANKLSLMLGGIGSRREKGMTEDEMAGWHYRVNGYEFG